MNQPANPDITMIDIGRVLPNPLNPRGEVSESECTEMAASMQSVGVLQPLLVTPYRDAFYAVAGHRRRIAAKIAGLTRLPCIVKELSESQQLDIMMIENLQRADLTPYQEACGFQKMVEIDKCSIADIVRRIGMSVNYITSRLDILQLDEGTQEVFKKGGLPIKAATLLKQFHDPKEQRRYAMLLSSGAITAKRLEELLRGTRSRVTHQRPTTPRSYAKSAGAVLPDNEVFTRREAIDALNQAIGQQQENGQVPFFVIVQSFDDVCEGLCEESDIMCQECPAPRMVASILRRVGVTITGQSPASPTSTE